MGFVGYKTSLSSSTPRTDLFLGSRAKALSSVRHRYQVHTWTSVCTPALYQLGDRGTQSLSCRGIARMIRSGTGVLPPSPQTEGGRVFVPLDEHFPSVLCSWSVSKKVSSY